MLTIQLVFINNLKVESHMLAHAVMTPVRIFPYLLDDQESQHLSGIRTFPKVNYFIFIVVSD